MKPIANVEGTFSNLKALIEAKKRSVVRKRRFERTAAARRDSSTLHYARERKKRRHHALEDGKNGGVEERDRKDREESETKERIRKQRLREKVKLYYEQISSPSIDGSPSHDAYLVDFSRKRNGGDAAKPPPEDRVLLKDEFGRDLWVERNSKIHKKILETEASPYSSFPAKDGGVVAPWERAVLSKEEKIALEEIRRETERCRADKGMSTNVQKQVIVETTTQMTTTAERVNALLADIARQSGS